MANPTEEDQWSHDYYNRRRNMADPEYSELEYNYYTPSGTEDHQYAASQPYETPRNNSMADDYRSQPSFASNYNYAIDHSQPSFSEPTSSANNDYSYATQGYEDQGDLYSPPADDPNYTHGDPGPSYAYAQPPVVRSESELVRSSRRIRGNRTRTEMERLDPSYQTVPEGSQRRFFQPGRVFMMLWTEPAAGSHRVPAHGGTRNGSHISTTWLNETAYSEIRRFVVVKAGNGNCICCPIHTYSQMATLKPNLSDVDEHAIIYTGSQEPAPHSIEYNTGEVRTEQLTKLPIKVNGVSGDQGKLHPLSRVNFSKLYTVENYVRVREIGTVDSEYLPVLDFHSPVKSSSAPRDDQRRSRDHRRRR